MGEDTSSGTKNQSGRNVLIDASFESTSVINACVERLEACSDPVNVLIVPLDGQLEEWLQRMHSVLTHRPANIGFVVAGETVRSPKLKNGSAPIREDISLRTVSSVTDVVGLSICITEYLSEWEDNDDQTLVYFDSVSTVLQGLEGDKGVRFLDRLATQLEHAEATAYFTYNPRVHDADSLAFLTRRQLQE